MKTSFLVLLAFLLTACGHSINPVDDEVAQLSRDAGHDTASDAQDPVDALPPSDAPTTQDSDHEALSDADTAPGGSRLAPAYRVLTATDGTVDKTLIGYHDGARSNELCTFASASDGLSRCLPIGVDATLNASFGFVDPACSKAIVAVDARECVPYVRTTTPSPSCGAASRTQVYAVAGETSAPSDFFVLSLGKCTKASTPTIYSSPGFKAYALSEVDPSQFMSAKETIE